MKAVSVEVPFIYRALVVKPRCRKPVEIFVRDVLLVEIKCLESVEVPVAFSMSNQNTYAFADRLWTQSFHTVVDEDPVLATLDQVLALTKNSTGYRWSSPSPIAPFFNVWRNVNAGWDKDSWSHAKPWLKDEGVQPLEEHIYRTMVDSNREETMKHIQKVAASMISVDGVIFELASEPRYYVITFGLSNNHGGTSLSVTTHYNRNIPSRCYFNAAQRDEAIKYAMNIATERGDDKSFNGINNVEMIEILMPEMVKVNPAVDHPVE